MAINASGGMASTRAKQLKKRTDRREAFEKQNGKKSVEDFEDDEVQEGIPTRLGNFLVFIDPLVAILIVINAIQMGVATFNFVEDNARIDQIFEYVDQIFLIIFSVEVSINFIHHVRLDRMTIVDHKITFLPRTAEEEKTLSECSFNVEDFVEVTRPNVRNESPEVKPRPEDNPAQPNTRYFI